MTNYENPSQFNIVLNSQYIASSSSGNNNDCSYEFNWTNIPQGKYIMSFSYRGKNNADLVVSDSPQVFLSLACSQSVYEASGEYGSSISNFIGSLRIETHAAGQVYYYSNLNDNPDVFFNFKPTNGVIRVQVFKDDFVTPFLTGTGTELADYVMVLSFKPVL